MSLAFSGLTGPALNFANAVQREFANLLSVPLRTVADMTELNTLNLIAWKYRPVFVLDIDGAGTRGVAISDGTNWLDYAGTAL